MTGFSKTVRKIVLIRSDGWCELCHQSVTESQQLHHRRARGHGGSSLPWVNQAANSLAVCLPCHQWIEGTATGSSRARSYEAGWLISGNTGQIAEEVPVMRRGQRVLLGNDGSVTPVSEAA